MVLWTGGVEKPVESWAGLWIPHPLSCTQDHPEAFSACLNYIKQFLVVLFSPQKEKIGKWMLHASSFIVCYFGRYSRLSLKVILFKLFFHANVCSLPTFGNFFFFCNALSQKKTKNKGWCHHVKACYSNALIVLKPVLSYQRTIAVNSCWKEYFLCFWQFLPLLPWS